MNLKALLPHWRQKPLPPNPPGWVRVPLTPTLAMILAGHDHTREGVTGVWKAMVEAALSTEVSK